MCVIAYAEGTRITDETVEKMFVTNPSGAGIAWRDGNVVRWKKGINEVAEIQELARTVPLPYVAHFRIPTVGGPTKQLCHPFPISDNTPTDLEGKTKGWVLFHNGHWNRWKEMSLESTVKSPIIKLPGGKWSDSRAMAWMASIHGMGVLEFIDEKVICFSHDDIEFYGSGWQVVDDILVSNKAWEWRKIGGTGGNNSGGSGSSSQSSMYTTPPHSMRGQNVITEDEVDDDIKKVVVMGPGGASAEDPFVQACRLFSANKMGTQDFKKARKIHDKKMKELRETRDPRFQTLIH